VRGLFNSLLTLVWTLLLLGILIFLFSIFALEIIEPHEDYSEHYNEVAYENFGNMPKALLTLLQGVTLDSVGSVYRPLILEQPFLVLYFLGFIFLVSIALMNLVTALMIETALDQSSQDKEAKRLEKLNEKLINLEKIRDIFKALDDDKSGQLTLTELTSAPEKVKHEIEEIAGTDDLEHLFQILDYDQSGLIDIDEFYNGMHYATDGKLELYSIMLCGIASLKSIGDALTKVERLDRLVFHMGELEEDRKPWSVSHV
jgi:hypothetical protein